MIPDPKSAVWVQFVVPCTTVPNLCCRVPRGTSSVLENGRRAEAGILSTRRPSEVAQRLQALVTFDDVNPGLA